MSNLEYLDKNEIEVVKLLDEDLKQLEKDLENDNLSKTEKELVKIKIDSVFFKRHSTIMFGRLRYIAEHMISMQEKIIDELMSGTMNKNKLKEFKQETKSYKFQIAENISLSGIANKLGLGSEE